MWRLNVKPVSQNRLRQHLLHNCTARESRHASYTFCALRGESSNPQGIGVAMLIDCRSVAILAFGSR